MRRAVARVLPALLLLAAGATILAGYRSDDDSGLLTMLVGVILLGLTVCVSMPTLPSIAVLRERRGSPASALPPEQMPLPYHGTGQIFGPGDFGGFGPTDGGATN